VPHGSRHIPPTADFKDGATKHLASERPNSHPSNPETLLVGVHSGEAWAFVKGEWVEVHPAEVGMNGAELDEESFLNVFGRLMALPAIVFQGRPDRWTASR